jgi:hypothetical protein
MNNFYYEFVEKSDYEEIIDSINKNILNINDLHYDTKIAVMKYAFEKANKK